MNKAHVEGHNKIVEAMRSDPRIVAAYLGGTTDTADEDEFSDVDSFFVGRDEAVESVRTEIARLIEEAFPRLLMLAIYPPEGPAENVAFHFLFEAERANARGIGKYDLRLARESNPFLYGTYVFGMRKRLLFDKTGDFARQLEENQAWRPVYDPGGLKLAIERYWQAVVMQVKLIRRGDCLKLEYAQNGLLQTHLEILRALCPDDVAWDWWVKSVPKFLPAERQRELLLYLDGLSDVEKLAASAGRLMKRFDKDARGACRRWGVEYPERLAGAVMGYFVARVGCVDG